MMTLENPGDEQQPTSRRGFAKAAIAALAVAGFGGAALTGVLARQGDDDAGTVGVERRRRRRRGRRRRRRGGSGGSGGSGGGGGSGGSGSGSGGSGNDD